MSTQGSRGALADFAHHGFTWRRVWRRPEILLGSLMINVLSLGLPIFILQIYDRVIPNNAMETLAILLVGLVGVLFVDALLRMMRYRLIGWWAARFEHAIGCRAVARLLKTDVVHFEREAPGAQLDRLSAIDSLRDFYGGQALISLVDLPFVLLFLALIGLIAGPLVIVPLVTLCVAGFAAAHAGGALRKAVYERQANDDHRHNFIIEVLNGIHTVKGLGMETLVSRRYERLQESSAEASKQVGISASYAQTLGDLFSQLTMAAVGTFGSLMVLDGRISVGMLAGCTLLAGRAMQPLLRALTVWTQFQRIRLAEAQVSEMLSMPLEQSSGKPELESFEGGIELRDLSFRHPGSDVPTLEGLNLKIDAGETIAIRGHNGAGKSTLLRCVTGLLEPTSGVVLLDGVDRAHYDPMSVRRHFAYLPQSGELFRGTILDNLTRFQGDERVDRAMALAEKLGLNEVFAHLPEGLNTRVGDGTSELLPRGVRQQIAIIRALVSRPRVAVFDESNTAFDAVADARFKALVEELQGDCTIILVTHRPSLARLASRMFEVRDGKLRPCDPPLDTERINYELRESSSDSAPVDKARKVSRSSAISTQGNTESEAPDAPTSSGKTKRTRGR